MDWAGPEIDAENWDGMGWDEKLWAGPNNSALSTGLVEKLCVIS